MLSGLFETKKIVQRMAIYFLLLQLKLHLMVMDMFWSQKDFVINKPLLYTLGVFWALSDLCEQFHRTEYSHKPYLWWKQLAKKEIGIVMLSKLSHHLKVIQSQSEFQYFYASVENFMPWKLVVGSCILLLHFLGEQGLKQLMCFGNQHIQEHICTPTILFLTKPVLFSNTLC